MGTPHRHRHQAEWASRKWADGSQHRGANYAPRRVSNRQSLPLSRSSPLRTGIYRCRWGLQCPDMTPALQGLTGSEENRTTCMQSEPDPGQAQTSLGRGPLGGGGLEVREGRPAPPHPLHVQATITCPWTQPGSPVTHAPSALLASLQPQRNVLVYAKVALASRGTSGAPHCCGDRICSSV